MRLIDADVLIDAIYNTEEVERVLMTGEVPIVDAIPIEHINLLNLVNVVRCKKCRHWEELNYEAPKQGWCNDPTPYCDGRWTDADDYCSYGEREDE